MLVSVATIETITAHAGMLLSARKYPFKPRAREPCQAPSAVQPAT